MNEKSVWTEHISARQARKVARALREAGYVTATIARCRDYVINVAQYFEPGNASAREKVLDIITRAAGIRPHLELATWNVNDILNDKSEFYAHAGEDDEE